jgi:hypothetical protein
VHRSDRVVTADRVLATLAGARFGLFTYREAIEAGWSRQLIDRRLRAGRIERVARGVYAFAGVPDSWEGSVLAAVLAAGDRAVASHDAAAALHGFEFCARRGAAKVHLAVPHHVDVQRDAVVVHRVILPDEHLTVVEGIRTTTYERTLVDMSARLGLGQIARILDAGLVGRQVEVVRLARMIEELGPAPGRRVAVLRMLLAERGPESEKTESPKEIRMLAVLRAAGVEMPTPQLAVVAGGNRYRLDGGYEDVKLGLEYLGFDPHRTRTAFDRDHERDRLLTIDGWTIAYFTSSSTDAQIVRTVKQLRARLGCAST